jgi:Coenzyme PQQ synthesis protein D (PqqD)
MRYRPCSPSGAPAGKWMTETIRLREASIEWRAIDDEIVALDRGAGEYIAVTGSGATLWPLLVAGTSRGALAETLAARFDIEPATAARDVDRFVDTLSARGLLEPR